MALDTRTERLYTTSDAFLEALSEANVEYCFVNLGSDHPAIMEAMAKAKSGKGCHLPKIITCPNEMVALSMADGYARLSQRAQCVIVHVDSGTQSMAQAMHNACVGKAPVLIFAGLSPCTMDGEVNGSRTEYIHWLQDIPDQKAIVSQYCRYTAEIKTGKNIKQIVNRALMFAMSEPKGPVYLTAVREVMEENIEPYSITQNLWQPVSPAALAAADIRSISELLAKAKAPLIVTGYTGRNPLSVTQLIQLTDQIPGLRVVDAGGSDMCFPADHRAWLGLGLGGHEAITRADAILVIDCDVPWVPVHYRPREDATIIHIDSDPLKRQMVLFHAQASATYQADSFTVLQQLNELTRRDDSLRKILASEEHEKRWEELGMLHEQRLTQLSAVASPHHKFLTASHVADAARRACPVNTIWCVEAVTNTVLVSDQIRATVPGSWINSGASGLGWSGGAALGIKLATISNGENQFVCHIVGDGSFMFSVPSSVYWISRKYCLPILTIVLNNEGWNAPRKSLLLVRPDGYGSKATNEDINISFSPSPNYPGIAAAAAGGQLWTGRSASINDLMELLKSAVEAVQGGTSAVLEVALTKDL